MNKSRRAFTLLELLLVLALLAMLAAFCWPAVRGSVAARRLRSAADQVRSEWLRARTKAVTSGETISFRYQPDSPRYRVEPRTQQELLLAAFSAGPAGGAGSAQAMTSAAAPPAVEAVDGELPESVSFAAGEVVADSRSLRLAAEDRVRSLADGSWSEAVLFYPDGTATAARVVLAGQRGRAIAVELRSLTGDARVGEVFAVEEAP